MENVQGGNADEIHDILKVEDREDRNPSCEDSEGESLCVEPAIVEVREKISPDEDREESEGSDEDVIQDGSEHYLFPLKISYHQSLIVCLLPFLK